MAAVVRERVLFGHGPRDGSETEHSLGDVRFDGLSEGVDFDVWRHCAGEVSKLCRLSDEACGYHGLDL